MQGSQYQRGFTLLEILLVVAAIAILAGIVIVAINPAQQLAETRDAQRRSDVNAISNAIIQYLIKNRAYPSTLPTLDEGDLDELGTTCPGFELDHTSSVCLYGVDSCSSGYALDVLVPDYIATIPEDPLADDDRHSGYTAYRQSSGRLVTCAPLTEEADDTISVTR